MAKQQALMFFGEPLLPTEEWNAAYKAAFGNGAVRLYRPMTWTDGNWWAFCTMRGRSVLEVSDRSPHRALRKLEEQMRRLTRECAALCGWELDES